MDNSIADDFVIEALEILDSTEDFLLDIEKKKNINENYNNVYRMFHSLKGSAGMLGFFSLQKHVHFLEDTLDKYKENKESLGDNIEHFLSGVDTLRSILAGNKLDNPVKESGKEDYLYPIYYWKKSVFEELSDYLTHSISNIDELKILATKRDIILLVDEAQVDNEELLAFKGLTCPIISFGENSRIEKKFFFTRICSGESSIKKSLEQASKFLIQRGTVNKAFHLLMYQFSDLEEFLITNKKENILKTIKEEIQNLYHEKNSNLLVNKEL